ncbi:MAG: hypothetical protein J07HX64_02425 [halophilic archaeon J07HX64]|nr:MAG: hypothetical protein J07HX64_02425 [halophilic archaeon J07HX64]
MKPLSSIHRRWLPRVKIPPVDRTGVIGEAVSTAPDETVVPDILNSRATGGATAVCRHTR